MNRERTGGRHIRSRMFLGRRTHIPETLPNRAEQGHFEDLCGIYGREGRCEEP